MSAPVPCGCMATSHDVFSLCLECGRILCALEVWGYCVACGSALGVVGAPGVAAPPAGAGLAAAEAAKARLLQYDRSSAARTRVLDDDEEYFSSAPAEVYDAYLSAEENAAAAAAAAAARAAQRSRARGVMTFTLDLGGGGVRVVDEARDAKEGARRAQLAAMAASGALQKSDAFHAGAAVAAAGAPPAAALAGSSGGGGGGGCGGGALPPAAGGGGDRAGDGSDGGAGTGAFANPFLRGSAGAVYSEILRVARERRGAKAAGPRGGRGR